MRYPDRMMINVEANWTLDTAEFQAEVMSLYGVFTSHVYGFEMVGSSPSASLLERL